MQDINQDNLPELDREEQIRIMQQWFSELWDDACEQGFEPEMVAQVIIQGAMRELVRLNGSQEAERVLSEIKQMSEHGVFFSEITLQ